jgi:hypothetical protein
MQGAPGRGQRAVPGNSPKHVRGDPGGGHPREPGVTQIVPTQLLATVRHAVCCGYVDKASTPSALVGPQR